MAVGFDAQLYFPNNVGSWSTTGLTISAGSNRALVVTLNTGGPETLAGITWGGVALTPIAAASIDDVSSGAYIRTFALLNPATGTGPLAGNANATGVVAAVSFNGVEQSSIAAAFPNGATATGSNSTATINITSAVGDAVVATFANISNDFTSTSGTNIYLDGVSVTAYCAASRDTGAATRTMSASPTATGAWAASGVDVVAAAPTGLGYVPPPSMFKRTMRSAKGPSSRSSGRWLVTDLPIPVTPVSSGDLVVTEAADVAAFAGDPVIAAALATTEATDTAVFAGGPVIAAALATTEATDVAAFAGSTPVTGTLVATEATDISSFAGSGAFVNITGTLAVTEAADSASFTASVIVAGTLATTEATDTAVFAGSVIVAGTLATTEATDVAVFAGKVGVSAALTTTEEVDLASFTVSVIVAGALATTEANDTLAFAGSVTFGLTCTLAVIEARDTASFSGGVANATTGVLAAREAGISLSNNSFPEFSAVNTVVGTLAVVGIDTAAFNGSVTGVAGTLAVTEAKDLALFASNPNVSTGTLAANEASILLTNNTFPEFSATNTVIGSLTVLGVDAAAFSGFVGVSGTLAITEATDVAAFAGAVIPLTTGVLTATEIQDSAAIVGTVFTNITGQLAVTEVKDSAAFNGAIFEIPTGELVATETRDAAVFSGSVTGIPGQLIVTEPQDVAAFNGLLSALGQLSAIELPDRVAFNGIITESLTTAILIVTEPQDVALFSGIATQPEQPDDSDFANWQFGHRFDRSLTSRFPWQSSFGSH